MDGDVVLEIYHCNGLLCGRIAWLRKPFEPDGSPNRDDLNPDPALRTRLLCKLTILDGLQPKGLGKWQNGHAYNAQNGETYDADATLEGTGTVKARIYRGLTLFGETKTLVRVPRGQGKGWC